jgi:hypothetical protein
MNVRAIGTCIVGATAVLLSGALNSNAQVHRRTQSSSAAQVAAEMTKGKLSPAASKPRDTVVLKLKDDLRSNGAVVLRKGTVITGVVRNVKCAEPSGQSQSMIEIVWLAPVQGKGSRSLSIALQSVMQINPIDKPEPEKGNVKTGAGSIEYAFRCSCRSADQCGHRRQLREFVLRSPVQGRPRTASDSGWIMAIRRYLLAPEQRHFDYLCRERF